MLFWSLFQAVYPTFTVVMWTKPVGDIIYKILIEAVGDIIYKILIEG